MVKELIQNSTTLDLPNGKTAKISIRRSDRARRLKIRILPETGQAELILPRFIEEQKGISFLKQKSNWVENHLCKISEPIPFKDGAIVPLFDKPLKIFHVSAKGSDVRLEGKNLLVSAPKNVLSRAITAWYKREAGCEITILAKNKSALLGKAYSRLTIRDTKSRWGSCSASGSLNFSWRLIMAPHYVLDYIVSHEIAHLIEMNHSKNFWRIVRTLSETVDEGQSWLRQNGHNLHRYGEEISDRV